MMEKLAISGGKPVRENPIYYGHQYIDNADIQAVVSVLKSDYLTCGPEINNLEKKLCKLCDAKYSVAVSSGTAALHAACYAAGIKEGDEVITTPMTFAASANCVLYCGAKPVFADIDLDTYNIDPIDVEQKITSKTKAIIAVDFTGQAVALKQLKQICNKYHLVLIEDGAHSIGTYYDGKPIGSIADLTTFSFHPVKTVTGGEGGAVLTCNKEYYDRLVLFRSHGITRNRELMDKKPDGSWYYQQIELGFNYRMTDIQAALISSQLDKLGQFKKRRKDIVEKYNKAFHNIDGVILQKEISESDTARHIYIIRINFNVVHATRREVFDALKAENVCCNVHYIPIYYFPYYRKLGYTKGLCPNAELLYNGIISIPLYYSMTDDDVDSVIAAVKKVIGYFSALN